MASVTGPLQVDGGVLAFIHPGEDGPGDTDKGVLNEGAKLSRMLGCIWNAAYFGGRAPECPMDFGAYGVPEVVRIMSNQDIRDFPAAQADALVQTIRSMGASVVVLSHDDQGAMLSPGLAASLGAALITEVISFERCGKGLLLSRRVLASKAVETCLWDETVSLVMTVDPRIMSPVVPSSVSRTAPRLKTISTVTPAVCTGIRILERIPPDPHTVDVSEADVIFCAGKGLDEQSFALLRELCRLLNATLGVTRPVYDLGFSGFERMIGQTGKTVAPRFYLALGISGSMHHVGGIKDSKCLVSLNIDPKAPIFLNSDECFVADVREVLPLLLEKIRAYGGGGVV
jgi:electron transfer flavoprotein alpha subunit